VAEVMEVTNKDNNEIDYEQNFDNIDVRPAKIYRRTNLINLLILFSS